MKGKCHFFPLSLACHPHESLLSTRSTPAAPSSSVFFLGRGYQKDTGNKKGGTGGGLWEETLGRRRHPLWRYSPYSPWVQLPASTHLTGNPAHTRNPILRGELGPPHLSCLCPARSAVLWAISADAVLSLPKPHCKAPCNDPNIQYKM